MTKLIKSAAFRLICFGGARRQTNAPGQVGEPEIEFPLEYEA